MERFRPGLIILDIRLREGDSAGICRSLKNSAKIKGIPIILCSAYIVEGTICLYTSMTRSSASLSGSKNRPGGQRLFLMHTQNGIFTAVMGQLLRITIGNADYAFRILKKDEQIEVEVGGQTLTLVRQERSWVSREPVGRELESIAEAIGKAIALRYRI